MYAAVDTYLVDATWVVISSWKNDTDAAQQATVEYRTELRVAQGAEVNHGYSIASAYKGMTITMERQNKVFKTTESTEAKTMTMKMTIPARSRLIFYQRRYSFKNSIFFILNAWAQDWNVGSWGGYNISRKDCTVEVFSDDFAILTTELDGSITGTMDVATVEAVAAAGATRKRDDCTERCKKKLEEMRV